MTRSKAEVGRRCASGVERRIQAFVQTCRRRGLKVTHQRMEIFRELAASLEHPDAAAQI